MELIWALLNLKWREATSYFLLMAVALVLSGCGLIANIMSLGAVEITNHEILEVDQNTVIVKLIGKCPAKSKSLNVSINGESKSIKTQAAGLVGGDIYATCEDDNTILVRYSLLDPNYTGKLDFSITAITPDGPMNPGRYVLDFERPQIPAPVITTNEGLDFSTNDMTPILDGKCIEERINGLEYRIDGGAWQTMPYVAGLWTLTSPTLVGSPVTDYLFEFRAVNTLSKYQYSEIRKIKITADTEPPLSGPTISGITSETQDTHIDTWLGGSYPKVHWAKESDHKKVQLAVYEDDEVTLVCPSVLITNEESYLFTIDTCSQALLNTQFYKIKMRGQDAAGNLSTNPSWFRFKVDLVPPTLSLTSTPSSPTKSNYATFAWTASAGSESPLEASAKCSIDNSTFTNCNSGITFENLTPGSHALRVSWADVAGNINTVTHTWMVESDILIPTCVKTSPDLDWINTTSTAMTFSCSDNDGVRAVKCRLSGSLWQDCDSFTTHNLTGLTAGEHFFQIQAQDHAGNLSPIIVDQFKVDLTGPLITWTLTPDSFTKQTSASLSFTVSDGASGVLGIECRLNSGAFTACASPYVVSGPLTDGLQSIDVKATDNAGNVETKSFTWTVDNTPPAAPIMGSSGEAGRKPTWTWTSGGGGNGVYRYKLDDMNLTTGTVELSVNSFTPLFDLPFGSHTLYVQERDEAGNWSTTSSQTFDAKCAAGEYLDSGNCQVCPVGTYRPLPNFDTACVTTPVGSYNAAPGSLNPTVCPLHSTTLSAGSTSPSDCLGDAGYWACEDGTCDAVGASHYSPSASNTRTACPVNSFTSGSGITADALTDCLAGVDYFDDDSDPATSPVAVGVGAYSPYRDDSKHFCTNLPSAATSVIYAGSGGGSNNCPIASVLTCDVGYIPAGTSCSDNSPGALIFTNANNVDPDTLTESNALVVNGFDGPLTASCTDCSGIALNGVWGGTSVAGFMPGDTIAIRRNSALSFSTGVLASVTLGVTTSSNWIISTRAAYDCNGGALGTIAHGANITAYSESTPLPTVACSSINEVRSCNDGVLSGSYGFPTCAEGCSGTLWGDVRSGYANQAYSSAAPAAACSTVTQTRTCTNGVMSGSFTNTSCVSGCTGTPWGNVASGYSNTAYSTATPTAACSTVAQTRTCTNGTLSGTNTATTCNDGCVGTPWGNLSHGATRTGYLYTTVELPYSCSSYSTTRTCSNGTLNGAASYNKTSCSAVCSSYQGQYCGTGYYSSCDSPTSGPISESGAWCSYSGAPYYQTGAVCGSNFQSNGADGINGTGDDIYSTNCYTSTPYNMYYDCSANCN